MSDALAQVKELLKDEIINDFVRELLADLRSSERDDHREWSDGVIDWLVDEMWGDPDPSDETG
jgi:hypothetical protein